MTNISPEQQLDSLEKQLKGNKIENQENGKLSMKIGELHLILKQFDKAITAYKQALYFYSKHALKVNKRSVGTCHFKIALAHEMLEEFDESIQFYNSAYNEGGREIMLAHKARILDAQGDERAANRAYEKYLSILNRKFDKTKDPMYMFLRIKTNLERNNPAQAMLALDKLKNKAKAYNGLEERIAKQEKEIIAKL